MTKPAQALARIATAAIALAAFPVS